MNISEYIDAIKNHPDFGPAFIHHHHIPAKKAAYSEDADIPIELRNTIKRVGIEHYYDHQIMALQLIRKGRHVLVATPTASGKSLIYNLAVFEAILHHPQTRALYLFPLKALEQDQLKNLSIFTGALKEKKISAHIYDGDTSTYKRQWIRKNIPEILVTNPDMLHRAILPHHENWASLFKNLSFVILDEVHTYRGIFGSHMNQVIRRLKRVCRLYGARPQFVMLSATVNNPGDFGENLIGDKLDVIDVSGAPRSGQHFVFLNPEISSNFSAAMLFIHCLQAGFRTIAFTQARKVTELMHVWVSQVAPNLRSKISSYRAGFMPEERRDIERRLADGSLLGVISTSALELGIDIGYLDICILVGYPGTIINTWQRGGRVGRSGRESLVILVAKPDALDQYFMRHPDDLFQRSFEAAIIDPHNPYVVHDHLPCAAAEHPMSLEDRQFWEKDLEEHLETLEIAGTLTRSAEAPPFWYATRKRPHLKVNIRSVGETYTIFEQDTGQAIGTVDGMRAFKECHPGAVYLHRAKQYLVDSLILEKKDIIAHQSELKYFTRSRTEKETEIIEINRSRPQGQFLVREGRLKVTETVTGYEKRALPGQELMGVHPLELPSQTFETIGFWIEIEPVIQTVLDREGLHFMGGIHAIEHGAIGIFPLFALCDRNDVGGICYTYHPQIEKPAIFIYDGHPGGVGLAQRGYEIIMDLLERTLDLIKTCPCETGCPSCIHSPKCGSGNKPLDKKSAIKVLEFLLGRIPISKIIEANDAEAPLPPLKRTPESPPQGPRIITLDLETQKSAQEVGGWNKAHLMRVSVCVIYDGLEGTFLTFTEDQIDGLIAHLKKADLVVGFNIKRFDYAVLKAYTGDDLEKLNTFDILEDVHQRLGFRIGLDHLATETLGAHKSADGLQALEWFKEGETKKLTEYCRQDVAITRDLFQFGLDQGHLVYRSKKDDVRLRLRVDWKLEDMIKMKDGNDEGI